MVEVRKEITIEIKGAKVVIVASLQNPADDEVTFGRKGEGEYHEYLFNVAETFFKGNQVQLFNGNAIYQNVASDKTIPAKRLPVLKEQIDGDRNKI